MKKILFAGAASLGIGVGSMHCKNSSEAEKLAEVLDEVYKSDPKDFPGDEISERLGPSKSHEYLLYNKLVGRRSHHLA